MSDFTPSSGADAPSSPAPSSALATAGETLQVFSGIAAFDAAQRMARALCSSTLVPREYQGQQGLANSLIALEIASRMRLSPLVVMQNMTPIHGRPTWSSKFLIATVNASGRFSPLRFVFDDKENPSRCHAVATDKASGESLEGETITLELARKEGWWSRKDRQGNETSKWQTMTGQMLRYRAAAWWANVYCPEIALGLMTQEEALDVEAVTVREATAASQSSAVPEPLRLREDDDIAPEVQKRGRDEALLTCSTSTAAPDGVNGAEILEDLPLQPKLTTAVAAPNAAVSAEPAQEAPNPSSRRRVRAQPAETAEPMPTPRSSSTPSAATEKRAPDPAPVPSRNESPTESEPVEAGLQQIPRIATLLELDAAYGRVNQLLGSGRINDENAERLWTAVARRRSQLEAASDAMASRGEVGA